MEKFHQMLFGSTLIICYKNMKNILEIHRSGITSNILDVHSTAHSFQRLLKRKSKRKSYSNLDVITMDHCLLHMPISQNSKEATLE